MRAVKKTASYPKVSDEREKQASTVVDITQLYVKLKEKEEVFLSKVENEFFIFKPLGRKDWKDISLNSTLNQYQKEEVICEVCTVFPENYDFEGCDAGVPTLLSNEIIKQSLLDSIDTRIDVTAYYRQDMYELDNQVTCIIHEVFPQFTLEDIENWGIEKTAKYSSRAEWVLTNLRGAVINTDPIDLLQQAKNQVPVTSEITGTMKKAPETSEVPEVTATKGKKGTTENKEKLTPERLADLKSRIPEINWENDNSQELLDSKISASLDSTPYALRTP